MSQLPSAPTSPGPRPSKGFTSARAEQWVLASAVLVGLVYAFRRIIEPTSTSTAKGGTAAALLGSGSPPPGLAQWAVAYGTAYVFLAVGAVIAPELAAALAMLLVSASVLTNGTNVAADLLGLEGGKTTATKVGATAGTSANTGSTAGASVGAVL